MLLQVSKVLTQIICSIHVSPLLFPFSLIISYLYSIIRLVSVSSPKLWAVSLFKTSLTRCVFLGVSEKGGEYNDISAISSSVNTMPGTTNSVRRRNAMGGTGMIGSVEGATGWRSARSDTEKIEAVVVLEYCNCYHQTNLNW